MKRSALLVLLLLLLSACTPAPVTTISTPIATTEIGQVNTPTSFPSPVPTNIPEPTPTSVCSMGDDGSALCVITIQVTNNTVNDLDAQIDGNYIAWRGDTIGDDEIYLYEISTGIIKQLSTSTAWNAYPQIKGNYVVWTALDEDVYAYQISSGITKNVSNNPSIDSTARISGDYVVWNGFDGDWEIFLSELSMTPPNELEARQP